MSEPTVPSSLPGRQPTTTQSIVRTRLTFTMPSRLPGRYGASRRLAITPSALCSHGSASSRESVAGARPTGFADQRLQRGAALGQRHLEQVLVVPREQVEGDVGRRGRLGEHLHARLRRVKATLEGVEVLLARPGRR